MHCGCVVQGNPFDMNEQIMSPCVIHARHAAEAVKAERERCVKIVEDYVTAGVKDVPFLKLIREGK